MRKNLWACWRADKKHDDGDGSGIGDGNGVSINDQRQKAIRKLL